MASGESWRSRQGEVHDSPGEAAEGPGASKVGGAPHSSKVGGLPVDRTGTLLVGEAGNAGVGQAGGLLVVEEEKPRNDWSAELLFSSRREQPAEWLGWGAWVEHWSFQMTDALCLETSFRMLFQQCFSMIY